MESYLPLDQSQGIISPKYLAVNLDTPFKLYKKHLNFYDIQ